MTVSDVGPPPPRLRELATRLDVPPGFRVEVLGGAIVISPIPPKKHGGSLRRLHDQLSPRLPDGRVALRVCSVEAVEGEDYASPDLLVTTIEVEDEEGWLVSPEAVDAVVEVVSPGNATTDLTVKPTLYSRWGIPIYLVIDPRHGTLRLYWDPQDGEYRAKHDTTFAQGVELPEPLKGVVLDTADLPRYGVRR
ncbi:Uma2 family endonuclease [Spiractinospora alimapuensis]|uniref:Uma2 family endonuclease n=1 Tax=Spiractinospora alimapuensis TaxID=2820884 RepID=UPI001F3081D8|nr:Uma2 family endonuclease [Spiractinospora alimapuensis]QVQ54102.1 Uma2 family endonuclease [Spiractinospora alimapuensis]